MFDVEGSRFRSHRPPSTVHRPLLSQPSTPQPSTTEKPPLGRRSRSQRGLKKPTYGLTPFLVPIDPALLKQCPLGEEVDVSAERDALVIRPVRRQPRQGWAEALAAVPDCELAGPGGLPRDASRLGFQGLGVVVRRLE